MILYIYFLVVSAFISISAFEACVVAGLIFLIYKILTKSLTLKGTLKYPLMIYTFPTILSNIFYSLHYIGRGIEESIFQFIYFLKDVHKFNIKDFERIANLFVFMGIVSSIVTIFKYVFLNDLAPIWGGLFEVGTFFGVFAIISLGLYLHSGKRVYLLIFIYFSFFVFFSGRRNSMIGYLITILIFLFVQRKFFNIKTILKISIGLLITISLTLAYLYKYDQRFQAMLGLIKDSSNQQLDTAFSLRWTLFWQGVTVIKNDIQNHNIIPILIGHGTFPGERLEPKSSNGSTYESIIFISETISRGIIGLFGILYILLNYYRFLFSVDLKKEDIIVFTFSMPLSILFAGSIFSGFWDALMPLYFLLFGLTENYFKDKLNTNKKSSKGEFNG